MARDSLEATGTAVPRLAGGGQPLGGSIGRTGYGCQGQMATGTPPVGYAPGQAPSTSSGQGTGPGGGESSRSRPAVIMGVSEWGQASIICFWPDSSLRTFSGPAAKCHESKEMKEGTSPDTSRWGHAMSYSDESTTQHDGSRTSRRGFPQGRRASGGWAAVNRLRVCVRSRAKGRERAWGE